MFDSIVDGLESLVVFTLFQIHIALSGDVAAGNDIINQLVVIVYHGTNAELNIFIDAQQRFIKMLADVHDLP